MKRSLITAIAMLGVLCLAAPADAQTWYYDPATNTYYQQQTTYTPGVVQTSYYTPAPAVAVSTPLGSVYYNSAPYYGGYYNNGYYYSPYRSWNTGYYNGYGRRYWRR
jgi:hypothetical protein